MAAAVEDRVVRNSAYTLGGHAAATIAAIVALPIVFRGLGTERFALLMLIWSIIAYATLFDLGIGRAVVRFASAALAREQPRKVPAILRSAMLMQLAIGSAAAALLALAAPLLINALHIPPPYVADMRGAIYAVALTIPVLLLSQSQNGILEAFERFDIATYVRTPATIATYLLPALGAVLDWSLTTIFVFLLGVRVLAFVVLFALCRRLMTKGRDSVTHEEFVEMLRFGGWLSVSAFAIALMLYLDRFLIAAFRDLNDVAQYTAPYDLAAKLLIIPGSIGAALFPVLSRTAARLEPDAARQRMRRAASLTIMIMLPISIAAITLGGPLLHWWLGAQITAEGITVFRILILATLLHAAAYAPVVMIEGFGRSAAVAKYHLIELPIYVIMLVVAIRMGGIVGAAWAWVIRSAWAAAWSYWYAREAN